MSAMGSLQKIVNKLGPRITKVITQHPEILEEIRDKAIEAAGDVIEFIGDILTDPFS